MWARSPDSIWTDLVSGVCSTFLNVRLCMRFYVDVLFDVEIFVSLWSYENSMFCHDAKLSKMEWSNREKKLYVRISSCKNKMLCWTGMNFSGKFVESREKEIQAKEIINYHHHLHHHHQYKSNAREKEIFKRLILTLILNTFVYFSTPCLFFICTIIDWHLSSQSFFYRCVEVTTYAFSHAIATIVKSMHIFIWFAV